MILAWKGLWDEWLRLNSNQLSWLAILVVLMLLVVLVISPGQAHGQAVAGQGSLCAAEPDRAGCGSEVP